MGIYLSFCEFTTVTDAKFVGLKNYLRVFSDPTFMHALWFTALFTIVSVLTINVFAFVIAMLLTKGIKWYELLPYSIFYAKPYWWYRFRLYLADPAEWNLRSFWKNTYLFFFLWILGIDHFNELAAGRLYDDHLYRRHPEYSGRVDRGGKMDGASDWQLLKSVTIPMVMPSITICTFLTLTNSFKLFDQNLALTAGEPSNNSQMLALNIFETFYGRTGWEGVGQAKAVIFFIIVAVIALAQNRLTRTKEVQQ